MPRGNPTARARSLGAELKELREATGMKLRETGARLGWSASVLSRIETGQRSASVEDVSALLALYEVTGNDRDRLLTLARDADQPGWWETSCATMPAQLAALISFESQATRVTDFGTLLVPGLLQTPEYTSAVMRSAGISSPDAELRVATRMGRQVVLDRADPPEYLGIIDEAVLRRPVGGPAVMAEQIRHIVKASLRPHVTVLVIPFDRGGHVGLDGPYVVLEFARSRTVVHLEHKRSSAFLDDPECVEQFLRTTDNLREKALDGAASAEFLEAVAAEYDQ